MRAARIGALVAAGTLTFVSATGPRAGRPASAAEPEQPAVLCTVTDPRITEASGLAATEEALYVVNDGGQSVQVFVLDHDCRVTGVLTETVDPFDVEDLARTADGRLWLSDTGDNDNQRETVALEVLAPGGGVTLHRLSYPEGERPDAEALLVGRSGQPFVVTKDPFGVSEVYTVDGPLAVPGPTPLREVATVDLDFTGTEGGPVGAVSQWLVTGGAVSPDGRLVALRTYTDLYLWPVQNGDIGAALRDGEPTRVALPSEPQGEAVTFAPDGRAVYTMSEGSPAPIHVTSVPEIAGSGTGQGGGDSAGPDDAGADEAEADGTDDSGSSMGTLVVAAAVAAAIVYLVGRLRRRSS